MSAFKLLQRSIQAGTPLKQVIDKVSQLYHDENIIIPGYNPTQFGGDYIKLSDVQTSGTAGGTFTSGAWQTRTLNTEDNNVGDHCTLSSNQFTLDIGTYRAQASAPAYDVEQHKLKLYNISDSSDELIGQSCHTDSVNDVFSIASVVGEFIISEAKTFEVQHRCAQTKASTGFGTSTGFGVSEVFAVIELWKVA